MAMLLPPEYPPEQCASENCQCKVLKGKKAGESSRGEIYSRRNHKNKLLSMVIVATSGELNGLKDTLWTL
jgi:hypothetical protein